MALKALVTTLVLAASSTAALARPIVRDHRAPVAQYASRARPVVIASQTSLATGRDALKTSARVSSVKLVALAGATNIKSIKIKFANGTTQKVVLGRKLSRRAPLTIDLDGGLRNVTGIVLRGTSNRRASFQVLGA